MSNHSQKQQLATRVNHRDVLAKFDAAVARSEILYSQSSPISLVDNGFEFQFRCCPHWRTKPGLPPAESTDPSKSDISQPVSLQIDTVPPAHDLTLNAYPVLRPSYLLLTASPLRRQTAPLDLDDIAAARESLFGLSYDPQSQARDSEPNVSGDYIVIYNSGRASGCSRFHKHMQLLPRPSRTSFVLFPDRTLDDPANVPYVYHLIRHPPSPSSPSSDVIGTPDTIYKSYMSSLDKFRALLNIQSKDDPVPHNVIMTKEWTVVIPRRSGRVGRLSTNAVGMMGMTWVTTEEDVEQWKKKGPWNLLAEMGVPVDNKT